MSNIKKEVSFDFINDGTVGCIHVTATCENIGDFNEVLAFVEGVKNLTKSITADVREEINGNKPL